MPTHDAMRDARRALGVGLHEVIELGAQGYRFATPEPAPALDVERLNRAFYNTPRLPGLQETARQHIERVAVEYARLGGPDDAR